MSTCSLNTLFFYSHSGIYVQVKMMFVHDDHMCVANSLHDTCKSNAEVMFMVKIAFLCSIILMLKLLSSY